MLKKLIAIIVLLASIKYFILDTLKIEKVLTSDEAIVAIVCSVVLATTILIAILIKDKKE